MRKINKEDPWKKTSHGVLGGSVDILEKSRTSVCLETVRLTNCFSVVGAFTEEKARLRGTESAKATRDRVLVQDMMILNRILV